jgi:PleD family two-component response regulator
MDAVDIFVKRHIRIMDFSSVYTDDRLVIALPETDAHAASRMLERLARHIGSFKYEIEGLSYGLNFKAGYVCSADVNARHSETLFEKAADALALAGPRQTYVSYSERFS